MYSRKKKEKKKKKKIGDMIAGEEENLLIYKTQINLILLRSTKSIVDHQNKNFTNNIKSLTQDDCITISDFKENPKIGKS